MAWTKTIRAVGLAAAAVIALQWNRIETQKTELASLQNQLQQASQQGEEQQASIKKLETRDESLTQSLRASERESAQLRASAHKPPAAAPVAAANPSGVFPEGKGLGSLMENMMKDPDMMKAMAEQQVQVLKTQYGPLVKQLNLTPEQRDAFYGLLSDNMTNALVQGLAMMSGTNNPDAASSVAGAQKSLQEQMKLLLGEDGSAQFQAFQASLPDRQMLEQMKSNFADNPLNDSQQQQLLQLMVNERKNSATAADPGLGNAVSCRPEPRRRNGPIPSSTRPDQSARLSTSRRLPFSRPASIVRQFPNPIFSD